MNRTIIAHLMWACGLAALVGGCQQASPPARVIATTLPDAISQQKLSDAKDFFYQSVGGNADALAPATKLLTELGGANSSDPQVVAYTGAATLLRAARAPFLERPALGHVGIDLEDRAVAMAPDDLEVRFLRGVTFYQLPHFLGKADIAAADLAYVAKVAELAAREGRLDPRAAAADLDYFGKVREQNYDATGAEEAWRAALRVDADSPGGRDALKHLAEHHINA